jgi:hypothetical protein
MQAVDALKSSEATKWYFAIDNPFENVERHYQLKFKATLDGVDYRCMSDLLVVDHDKKIVYPVDLKTSSHTEWDFYQSFVDWHYHIQARLYWRIIRHIMDNDEVYKDYKLDDYRFIVVNKRTLTPLVWLFDATKSVGDLVYGKNNDIIFKDKVIDQVVRLNVLFEFKAKSRNVNNLPNVKVDVVSITYVVKLDGKEILSTKVNSSTYQEDAVYNISEGNIHTIKEITSLRVPVLETGNYEVTCYANYYLNDKTLTKPITFKFVVK